MCHPNDSQWNYLSQFEQCNAASLTRTAKDNMERFGTEVVREHQNTIQVCQNNVAAQAIGEVGKHRIHDREKSMEDDYSELDLERMKPRDNFNQKMEVIEEMKVECERKIEEMVYECNQKLKTVEDEWNQKLNIKEDDCNQKLRIKDDDCNQKLKIKEDDCNQKLKTKDDDCNQKLKTKDDDCNQKLAIKDDDCNQKLKIKEDDCNQKLRIKDDDCNQKLKVKEDDCNQKLKIKDNDCNQKLEKMKVELKRKIKEVEDDCDQKLKVKEDDCNQKLKVKEDDCNQKLQIKDDEYETLKRDLQNRQVGMFCSKLTKDFQMAYPSNSICTYGLLCSAGESDPVFPMTAEANDEKTVARISIDTLGAEGVKKLDETTQEEPGAVGKDPVDDTRISVVKISREESSEREGIRLGNVPTTAVERSLYNNYKFLLQIMSQRLLSNDLIKLKEWAEGTFSIDANSRDAIEIFRKLDQQEVISASNLVLLREFFEKILRIDLAHLIDCFMRGDYSLLRNTNSSFPRNGPGIPNGRFASRSPQGGTGTLNPRREPSPTLDSMNTGFSKAVEVNETFVDRSALEATRINYHSPVPACRGENPSISQRNVRAVADCQAYNSNGARNRAVEQKEQGRTTESRTPVESRAINHSSKPSYNIGSNGQKHSKFQREDSQRNSGGNPQNSDDDSDDDVNEQLLCNHYKRRCHVKFACCSKYWPCHRCHNNESNCGQTKLKSIHTKFVKCTKCSTEQEFSERSQFCINCHTKFAKYFCSICKHLTGKDGKPYHCGKCGICRIHKHRSFHCDVCGVCLDVQLRDNHKCREGSAHDECCICLEDAFTGCQILPCSHKVHKECATRMIRSGITRCPICRESFAHKLEKRPSRIPHKQLGKE